MSITPGFLMVCQSNMLGQIIIGFLFHARVLTPKIWNGIPASIKEATAFCQFKRLWSKYARSDQFCIIKLQMRLFLQDEFKRNTDG